MGRWLDSAVAGYGLEGHRSPGHGREGHRSPGRPSGAGRCRGAAQLVAARLAVALLVAGCSAGQPLLAEAPAVHPTPPPTARPTTRLPDPQPLAFPRDDGPHDRLTEWWYHTGHLVTADGRHFGFEFVVFRAERGGFPVSWASHLALTDESAGTFVYDQRTAVGPAVDRSPTDGGFDLSLPARTDPGAPLPSSQALPGAPASVGDQALPGAPAPVGDQALPGAPAPVGDQALPRAPAPVGGGAWTMSGAGDREQLTASSAAAGFGLDLTLDGGDLPPLLHGSDGWVDFGPAGGSYYYSRPRLTVSGTLTLGGTAVPVSGLAWFDHQWGDFIAVGGGWDWFAVDLDDGSALTVSLVRAADGSQALAYGTLMRHDGTAVHLGADDFEVRVLGHWTSPHTGAVYPAGWQLTVRREGLAITLRPTVADQELDTRASTGVVYWEGSQVVTATRGGAPLGGQAYVELTGYAPATAP